MKYIVLVSAEVFSRLNEKPDWESVWVIKDDEETKYMKAINKFQDDLIEGRV